MTGIVKVSTGMIVSFADEACLVLSFETPTTVRLEILKTKKQKSVDLSALSSWPPAKNSDNKKDLLSISEKKFKEAQNKFDLIKPLLEKESCTVNDVKAVAKKANAGVSSVYRWLQEYRSTNQLTAITRKERADTGKSRLTSAVERIVSDVLSDYWLTPEKRSYAHLQREISRRCRNVEEAPPSLPTIINRANQINPKEVAKRRYGRAASDRLRLNEGTISGIERPYSLLQIDHTLVDIELVDTEHRTPIGRPWITVAIDVYSRMIAGYYISFDPPGMLGTGICIANAVLPKAKMLMSLGLDYDYPCMGKPQIIHLDNAREFHSVTLERACYEYGIDIQYRKIATPRYGGHIERLMGTFATEVKALSGTTFSNYVQKGDYDSSKNAVFTLKNFEKWVAHLFLGVYHNRVHSALSEPPLSKYTKAILGEEGHFAGIVEYVVDEEKLRLDFLPMFEGTIQTYGVKIDHVTYASDVLRRWVGAKDPNSPRKKRKFIFRRDPRDISYIYFYDPDAQMHFKVPYRDRSHPVISLWELRAVRNFTLAQGKKAVNEAVLFKAYNAMRDIEQQQERETLKTRRSDAQRRKLRRKESPQPKLLAPKSFEEPMAVLVVDSIDDEIDTLDGYDEIERY